MKQIWPVFSVWVTLELEKYSAVCFHSVFNHRQVKDSRAHCTED